MAVIKKTSEPKYIFTCDSNYREIKRKRNRLSSHSKFYLYENKIYELLTYCSGGLKYVDDLKRITIIKRRFNRKFKLQRAEELVFMRSLSKACLTTDLVKAGAYKFKVEEKCRIADVPIHVYNDIKNFLYQYFEAEKSYISNFYHSYTFIPVYDPKLDKIGYFIDHNPDCLNFNGAGFRFIDYQLYKEYFSERKENMGEILVKKELGKITNRFEIIDI